MRVLSFLILFFFIVCALFAPFIAPQSPIEINHSYFQSSPPPLKPFVHPSFILGSDDVGRDILSRLIYGARISIGIGFLVVILSALFGAITGLFIGYVGGWPDRIVSRVVDALMGLPSMLLAVVIIAILGPSLMNATVAIVIINLPTFVRLGRALCLQEKNRAYVDASKTFGASTFRQVFINIAPNAMGPLIVQMGLSFGHAVLELAALSFLGMGARPPTPEWGVMLADAKSYMSDAPWMTLFPGLCLLLVVLAVNFLSEDFRHQLDPKTRERR